jgi:anaerobic dimethyl sulfoxide reductase subunit C (anchor subunit)
MNLRESALVAFTLLMQASVGIVLVLAVLAVVQPAQPKGAGAWALAGRVEAPLAVAAAAAVLGLGASLLHLGQPLLAWLALANVRGSWLSREVALAIVFVAALAIAAVARGGDAGGRLLPAAATGIAALAGLALVLAMARLYMIPGQAAWHRLTTPAAFFASTLLLGVLVVFVFDATRLRPGASAWLGAAALVLLALQVMLAPGLLVPVPSEPAAAISAASVGTAATWLVALRILTAGAAGIFLFVVLRVGTGADPAMRARCAALVLAAASEIAGRILFYAASARLGPV